MEYTIAKLARMSGVTARALRHYDQIGLLCPVRVSNGYRIYGEQEVDRLQQILFYRELGVQLKEIAAILDDPAFDRAQALEHHLAALRQEQARLELLIGNVTQTIRWMKGESSMNDSDKFKGFKENLIRDNESRYGEEIRRKYGDDTVNASYANVRGMTREKLQAAEALGKQIEETLAQAFRQGDPAGALAQQVFRMHRQWICMFWPEGMYSPEAHMGLANLYVEDVRFRAVYDQIAPGCAQFLRDIICSCCS